MFLPTLTRRLQKVEKIYPDTGSLEIHGLPNITDCGRVLVGMLVKCYRGLNARMDICLAFAGRNCTYDHT